jgi:hypothetical protein
MIVISLVLIIIFLIQWLREKEIEIIDDDCYGCQFESKEQCNKCSINNLKN